MIGAYVNGKDLYSTVAAQVYDVPYEECKEFRPDGSLNPEGKKRRGNCKSICLGLLYGRGTNSVAEQIGSSFEEAQELVDKFFGAFPTVKDWIEGNKEQAYKHGYVRGIVGRRRRLPDIQLPKYVVKSANTDLVDFNPLLGTTGLRVNEKLVERAKYYEQELLKATSLRQKNMIKAAAEDEGFKIQDNGGFIAQAERQSTNAIIQGSAATLTKMAMINVDKDEELKKLGFRMFLCVHDELMGECPKENADAVGERLAQIMIDSAKPVCVVPMKCDTYQVERWYGDEIMGNVKGKFDKDPSEENRQHIYEEYHYINKKALDKMMDGTIDLTDMHIHFDD